ncbi:MAG: hypothetical protein K9L17_04495 [Clostridiales bacterium]|nr:hypothetical protein [Clostridiales bacterium]MCF8021936.1 hypothetical protein [Clostridiales bacterium]
MSKRVQGFLKNHEKNRNFPRGYKPVWDMGKAGESKKYQRMTGIQRPST